MEPYLRKVQYYETDRMGIVHHSNYVRWMEEARIAFLESIGISFASMEAMGIVSPVTGLSVDYKKPCTFGDTVEILVEIEKYNGIEFDVRYTMHNRETGDLLALASSRHCFLVSGRVISLKKQDPALHASIVAALSDGSGQA